jgi:hypothetical protein
VECGRGRRELKSEKEGGERKPGGESEAGEVNRTSSTKYGS